MSPPRPVCDLLTLHSLLLLLLLGARPGGSILHHWRSQGGEEEPFCVPFNYTCGPIAPAVPLRYEAHLEQTDLLYNITHYIEEFYDYEADVLAVTDTWAGSYTHTIFFYAMNKVVVMYRTRGVEEGITPTTCTVSTISHNAWLNPFPGQDNATHLVLAPSQALFFGGNYKYSWIENNRQRGMECNRWDACITDSVGTFYVEYEWSDPSRVMEVPGFSRERPVRVRLSGLVKPFQGSTETLPFEAVYNMALFDDEPRVEDIRWAFEIPSGVFCEGLPAGKKPPKAMAKAFSARVEVTLQTSVSSKQEYMSTAMNWYDFYNSLTRYDSITNPATVEYAEAGMVEVAVIRDFRAGVEYIVDKSLGNCTTIELTGGGFDTITTPDGSHNIKDPLLIFGLDNANLTYHGTKYARGLPCDVWVGHFDYELDNNTIHDAFLYEVYMLQDGWTEEAGTTNVDYSVPVLTKIFQDYSVGLLPEDLIVNIQQNIFKFQESMPLMSVFDITPCFIGHDHIRRFQMAFPGTYRDFYDKDPNQFKFSVQSGISIYLPMSPIRLQQMEIEYMESDDRLYCEFALVDQPQVDMDYPLYVGPPLDVVVTRLENVMDEIAILFVDENMHLVVMKPYNDSLKEMFEDGCYSRHGPSPLLPSFEESHFAAQTDPSPRYSNVNDERKTEKDVDSEDSAIRPKTQQWFRSNDEKIYSPGDMAGMAVGMLLLGLLLGTVVMLAILKKMGLSHELEFIPMNSRRQ